MDPTRKPSCEDLDARIRSGEGDETLFEAIAECLAEDVKRFAQVRCGRSKSDVEDITQDALLAAKRYLDTFRGEASLRTWLYRLVVSACSRQRRGRKNDPHLHRSLDAAESLEDASDPETEAFVAERIATLEAAIQKLRPEDQRLLSEVEWDGLSLEKVAELRDLTVPAVKSRMFRIRKQLRDLVAGPSQETAPGNDE
jgi:RNA polymerase sigma-70 factor, ECF subfamily